MSPTRRITKDPPQPAEVLLLVSQEKAARLLQKQIDAADELLGLEISSREALDVAEERASDWRSYTDRLLKRICSTTEFYDEFQWWVGFAVVGGRPTPLHEEISEFRSDITEKRQRLVRIVGKLELYDVAANVRPLTQSSNVDPVQVISMIAGRFHRVVHELRNRRENRDTLVITDEYDVQDLLRALLSVHFDDIRPEEHAPSVAGRSPRLDFLLKQEQLVVEVKKTREGLRDAKLGDELLQDIGRYAGHADCKTLYCFVYDPDRYISNAYGIEHDLSKMHNGLRVIVKIIQN